MSFITSPLVVGRENGYIVFVTDTALASAVQSFEWAMIENAVGPSIQTTQHGEFAYIPTAVGTITLTVRLLGTGNSELAILSLQQDIAATNVELEDLIAGAKNEPGPAVSNPDVARELINDHNPYYQNVALTTPEVGQGFKRFVFDMVFDGALQRAPADRKRHIADLASSLNNQGADFAELSGKGAGVSGTRLAVLAMILPDMLSFTELPEPAEQRALADQELRDSLAALSEEQRIDLFNLLRCPKSNIRLCARIIESLRDRYFAGTNFEDVLTGMSGTRAHWIIRHFREGPLVRT
ncbi:MAG TPA: hypothetical protein VMZ26_12975 [Pyrinomonadaceae bacterium]|nr:hypothetical protein [Pyrinomonadaceae bacterium]